MVTLYSYWRSTTSYRVRIALDLKGVAHRIKPIDLVNGAQASQSYATLNPIKGVPTLALKNGQLITQSMAILRYLDVAFPDPPLWPDDAVLAAQAEAAALVVATDIHPVNNLKVGARLKEMGHSQDEVVTWMNHWMREGLLAFQRLIDGGTYCFGDMPTIADICLIPQLYNAHRWGTDLAGLDRLLDIEKTCLALAAFKNAHPEAQPDAT